MVTRTNLDGSRITLFSDCDLYRYFLLIRWGSGPTQAVIGVNPSKADEFKNDPTIERTCRRVQAWGAGGLLMLNAFAWRSTDPKGMLCAEDPYGEWRDAQTLVDAIRLHGAHERPIAAWGENGKHLGRSYEIRKAFAAAGIDLYALDFNKSGEAKHPLYCPYGLIPKRWPL